MRLHLQVVIGSLALFSAACSSADRAGSYVPALPPEIVAERSVWTAGERREGLAAAALELPGWTGGAFRLVGDRVVRAYAVTGTSPDAAPGATSLVVEVEVAESPQRAHDVLAEWLAGRQAPVPARRAPTIGIDVGDVSYADAPDGRTPRWVAFVRGNVAIRILDVAVQGEHPDVGALARALDGEAQRGMPLAPDTALPRPALPHLHLSEERVVAGDVVTLELELREELAAPLVWTVGGPGQGYVERGPDGEWRLHTTAPGALHLTCAAIGRNLAVARASTALVVDADRQSERRGAIGGRR